MSKGIKFIIIYSLKYKHYKYYYKKFFACCSDIYCRGELLDDVQMQRLYPDSKTFVDKKLLRSEEEILEAYQELKLQNNGEVPTGDVLSQFIDENFADDPLVEWVPPDFVENPSVVDFIHDVKYR